MVTGRYLLQIPPGLRKSGTPDAVLTPAPVKATTRRLRDRSRRAAASGSIDVLGSLYSHREGVGLAVKVLIDESVPEAVRNQVETVVKNAIGDRPDAETLVVSLVKLSPGRGWEVFINDLQDPPLVDAIQSALKKGGF